MERGRGSAAHPRVILAVLSLGGGAYALLQSLVVPALPVLQRDLHTSTVGRRVDLHRVPARRVGRHADRRPARRHVRQEARARGRARRARRREPARARSSTTLPLMIVARAIQGLGGAIFPLAFGIIRDEFPRERVAGAIALISGILGIGGGLGIILAGPILEHLSYHWLFWIPLVVIVDRDGRDARARARSRRSARPATCHWLGRAPALGLARGAARSRSARRPTWGWGSTRRRSACSSLAAVLCRRSGSGPRARSRHPLVDMKMMRLRGVWTTNLAALPARVRDVQRVRPDPAVRGGARRRPATASAPR